MSEHLACHRTVGASIVMLIASGLAGSGFLGCPIRPSPSCYLYFRWSLRTGFPRPAHSPASGPVRRSVRVPSASRFDLLLPPGGSETAHQLAVPDFPFRLAAAWLLFRPSLPPLDDLPAPRHSLHLRFARSTPKSSPSVFSDAAAGIVAGSIGFSFPFWFQRFPVQTSSAVSSSRQLNAATQK